MMLVPDLDWTIILYHVLQNGFDRIWICKNEAASSSTTSKIKLLYRRKEYRYLTLQYVSTQSRYQIMTILSLAGGGREGGMPRLSGGHL